MILHASRLKNKHRGKPIIVMGAGISLPDALERALAEYPDAILISCNHRALRTYPADYAVCFDKKTPEWIRNINKDIPIISHFPTKYSNYLTPQLFDIINTGVMGAWVARYLGGNPVILCGMDFYQGVESEKSPYYDGRGNVRDSNKTEGYAKRCKKRVQDILKDCHWISCGGYLDGEYNKGIIREYSDKVPKLYLTNGIIRGTFCADVTEVEYYEWERQSEKWRK